MSVKKERVLGYAKDCYFGSIEPFNRIFKKSVCIEDKGAMEQVDAVVFWGGADIHPSYYRENPCRFTGAGNHPSQRDEREWRAMLYCKVHDIPMIGLCRGGQFLTVFAGGKLVQHVSSHNHGNHMIETINGDKLYTNSVHHQMMDPYAVPHQLLAWSSPSLSKTYLNGDNEETEGFKDKKEPEIVFYPEIRGLAIQGHPEYSGAPSNFRNLCVDYVHTFLFNEKIPSEAV